MRFLFIYVFWKLIFDISSLAAYSLQQLGLLNATDMIGGYEAWKAAGLPIGLDNRQESGPHDSLTGGSMEKLDRENSV
jgi:hypothetical protein